MLSLLVVALVASGVAAAPRYYANSLRSTTNTLPLRVFTADELREPIPESFDAATKWPDCKTITDIRDESACGASWAMAAASAMSDRYCIAGGEKNLAISTASLMCCWYCGRGCDGGNVQGLWEYWLKGVFDETCQPYPLPKCEHQGPAGKYPVCPHSYPSPPCRSKCYNTSVEPVLHFGKKAYRIGGEASLQRELMTSGPLEVTFDVYSDWLSYKSGVYAHTSKEQLGWAAAKLVGWGVSSGTPYWKLANSMNEDWGMDGYFLMKRGSNECNVEVNALAGTPKIN